MWYLVVRLKIDGTNKLYFWITFGNGVGVCTSIFKTVNEFGDISWQVSLNIKKQWEIQNFVYLFPNTKLQSVDTNLVIVYVLLNSGIWKFLYLNIQFYKTTISYIAKYLVVYITYFCLKHFGDKWIGDHIHLATKKYYYSPKKIIRITFLTVPIIRKLVWQSISLKTIQNVFFFLGSNKSFECTCNSHFVSWKPFFTLLIILQRNKTLIICIFIAYRSIDMQLPPY